ncbi:MAG TPA: hypothetical protein VN327_14720 [Pseudonocardiaceae bacterium]|nr:hypothetical protein [Pseudonocardiaceae bacterium]
MHPPHWADIAPLRLLRHFAAWWLLDCPPLTPDGNRAYFFIIR